MGQGTIPDDAQVFCLNPGEFYLYYLRAIGTRALAPDQTSVIPEMKAKSTFGRQGLTVALCAGLGDVGYCSKWALEFVSSVARSFRSPWARQSGRWSSTRARPPRACTEARGTTRSARTRFLPKPLKWLP